ncbi:unnamed protein product [Symbiodinium sp. CCMP2592]|nr:unnamed protein product [Symbiodinium sp. CCMP2592]
MPWPLWPCVGPVNHASQFVRSCRSRQLAGARKPWRKCVTSVLGQPSPWRRQRDCRQRSRGSEDVESRSTLQRPMVQCTCMSFR